MSQFIKAIKPAFEEGIRPFLEILTKLNVSPNFITVLGLLFTTVSVFFIINGKFLISGVILTLGSILDAIDGALARRSNQVSKFGAFLDSTVDRIADFLPLAALAYYFRNDELFFWLTMFTILFSFLISYERARAEGLGLDCKVGFFERPERLIILIVALISGFVKVGIVVLFIGTLITALQRLIYVYKKAEEERL